MRAGRIDDAVRPGGAGGVDDEVEIERLFVGRLVQRARRWSLAMPCSGRSTAATTQPADANAPASASALLRSPRDAVLEDHHRPAARGLHAADRARARSAR